MGRLSIDKATWARIRAAWEHDPRLSFAEAGAPYGANKQTVHARAHREGWAKQAQSGELARKAHAVADAAGPVPAAKPEPKAAPKAKLGRAEREAALRAQQEQRAAQAAQEAMLRAARAAQAQPSAEQREAAEDNAVALRAAVLQRHRTEWAIARKRVYEAARKGDFELAKLGKITSEALKIVQDGERRAWGLDTGGDGEYTVIIERKS